MIQLITLRAKRACTLPDVTARPLSNGGAWLSHRKNDAQHTTPANTAIRSPSNRELPLALEAFIHETFSEIHEIDIEHSGAVQRSIYGGYLSL